MTPSVAVVTADTTSVAVWHVAIDNDAVGISRMCGAWVYDKSDDELAKVELLTRGRQVVATPSGEQALQSVGARPLGFVDLAATINAVAAERDRLHSIYDQLPAARKKTLTPPRWPHIPDVVDLAYPPRAHNAGDPRAAEALGIARLLEDLAAAWSSLEGQRVARTYLTDATPGRPSEPRDLPLVMNP